MAIKKSTWLMISLFINGISFLLFTIVSIAFGYFDNIFFFFCIVTGIHQIVKSMLFKFDSACYLGVVLLLMGGLYLWSEWFNIEWLYSAFIVFSFSFSSFVTGNYFKEPFQLFLSFLLFFVGLGLLLFLIKIVSVWIFVAILTICMLLLIVRFFIL